MPLRSRARQLVCQSVLAATIRPLQRGLSALPQVPAQAVSFLQGSLVTQRFARTGRQLQWTHMAVGRARVAAPLLLQCTPPQLMPSAARRVPVVNPGAFRPQAMLTRPVQGPRRWQ